MKEKQKINLNQKEISVFLVFGILVILMTTSVIYDCISLIKKNYIAREEESRVTNAYVDVEDNIVIEKQDKQTGELLKGVKFAIYQVTRNQDGTETLSEAYDTNDEIVGTEEVINGKIYHVLETDENGTIANHLKKGLYKVIEVKALEGYSIPELNESTHYFDIEEYSDTGANYSISLDWERADIVEIDIQKTTDGGYVGVHDKTITKYDSNFNVVWSNSSQTPDGYEKRINNGYGANYFQKVIVLNDGSYIAIADDLLCKYSSSGEVEWAKQGGNNLPQYSDAIFTSDGNLLVGIKITSALDSSLSDYIIPGNDGQLFSVRKYDLNGNQIWKNDVMAPTFISQYGYIVDVNLLEDDDNNYIVYANRGDMSESDTNPSSTIMYKFDKDGNEIWSKVYGNITEIHGASDLEWLCLYDGYLSEDGAYVFVGTTSRYPQYGVYGKQKDESSTNKNFDATGVIVKIDKDGNILWMKENIDTNLFIGIEKLNNNYIIQGENSIYLYSNDFEQIGKYTLSSPMASYYASGTSFSKNLMIDFDAPDMYSKFITLENNKVLIAGNDSIRRDPLRLYTNNKMTLLSVTKDESQVPDVQKIIVYNSLKEYNIITDSDENGTISGKDDAFYEKVKHGKDATKDIVVTPNAGYKVGKILVNGEEQQYNEGANGVVILPKFTNVKEDKLVMATFSPIENIGYVHVKYLDINTKESISEEETIKVSIGKEYETSKKDIEGYVLVEEPTNKKGILDKESIDVVYYYAKQVVEEPKTPLTGTKIILVIVTLIITATVLLTTIRWNKWKRGERNA